MGTSPFLTGAVAAQGRMDDARRDAEQRRLTTTVGLRSGSRQADGLLAQISRRLRRLTAARFQYRPHKPGFRTTQTAHSAKP
jgi:hypothetical protein